MGSVAGDGGFDPAAVEAARVVAETALGDVTVATARHERGGGWRWLPTNLDRLAAALHVT